ncbi:uncharacterized protein LOC108152423 isoform X2 [Drosophila miranda]|uniref:uncharacterized protein LOC108152423 isoform X2 n=1 Tax=Drosophila miranda TaxID=7229 RepID=UPI0007E77060|nr:uncharacterized protein LOC108152423 isoform X2 [Drosophila miranda]
MISNRHFRRLRKSEREANLAKLALCSEGKVIGKLEEKELAETGIQIEEKELAYENTEIQPNKSPLNDELSQWFIEQRPKRACVSPKKENEEGKTCSDVLNELKKTTETLQLENAAIRDQLQKVLQILADQTDLIKQQVKEKGEMNPIREHFPIKSEEQLIELEEKIKLNRSIYITEMKSVLQPTGVLSSLSFIMSEEIVLAYNVDGVQGKKALRSHKEFFAALLECIPPGEENSEGILRKAMQRMKKKFFKKKYMEMD